MGQVSHLMQHVEPLTTEKGDLGEVMRDRGVATLM